MPTKPVDGQKTGTSGLRKKTKEFMSENYLANWVQSLFNALGGEVAGKALGLGGDGRYFGKEAAQVCVRAFKAARPACARAVEEARTLLFAPRPALTTRALLREQ